ncbi:MULTISPECIES: hypothetical protein [Bacillus]|uniref:hypothetical protein n=1 Tax=Bacillus TaxID=1386 RepID=UPI00209FC4A7|nr:MULTISPECIES: hypothetical protein [Bacillus]MCP1181285.1 hypothetical protein [Bacillus sp. 1663tsa1]
MTRKVSNLFPNSATREKEIESKQQQSDNVNVNETITEPEQNEIQKETPENNDVNDEKNEILTEPNEDVNEETEAPKVPEVPEEPGKNDPDEKEEEDDVLAFLNETNKKVLVGFYLDEDINKVIKKLLGKKPGRGAQSQLANNIFRKFFEEKGLL